jgi:hypothetical protein
MIGPSQARSALLKGTASAVPKKPPRSGHRSAEGRSESLKDEATKFVTIKKLYFEGEIHAPFNHSYNWRPPGGDGW